MPEAPPPEGSLVLYRARPARVGRVGDKLTLELEDGSTARVRPKDVTLLHPGPLANLAELRRLPDGDVETAWEILAGSTTTLRELAELAFGAFTPAAAWGAWTLVADGLHFRGGPDAIVASRPEEVAAAVATRQAEAAERRSWQEFLARVQAGRYGPEDVRYLRDVEALALGRADRSRTLRALGREESPENAHALLLDLRYWDVTTNPHPHRLGVPLEAPSAPDDWPERTRDLPGEERADLTGLPAYAIDDAHTEAPDDALSYVPAEGEGGGGRLWVHVADPAAVISPDDPLDLEARARGATLYLPEGPVPMLPKPTVQSFSLGLTETSPALSFGLDLDAEGRVAALHIVPSRVRVTRLTYEEAEGRLDEEPLRSLLRIACAYAARRAANGAIAIDLPEVTVRVVDGTVEIRPVASLQSNILVENAMIMAGEAVANHALAHGIPVPYASQEPPETDVGGEGLAAMYALRRGLKRSQFRTSPSPHAGLGLAAYVQVTSPLRRYLDLVVHQQLRAWLRSQAAAGAEGSGLVAARRLLTAAEVVERIGAAEAVLGSVRQAESLSARHWVLVSLLQQPGWRGQGILVEKRGRAGTFLVPSLGIEAQVQLSADMPLDSEVTLRLRSVDLPRLEARFKIESH